MVFESKFFGLEDALVTSGCHDTAVMPIGCIRSLTWGSCYDTIRYDTRCYFNVRSKADISQLNLPHGTDN